MIVFDRVEKRFGEKVVLSDLSFDVAPGEHVTLIGPSGSGKTTILRLLMCLESVTGGTIKVGGRYLSHMERRGALVPADEKYSREVRKRIGMVFQQFNLFPNMTVRGNLIEAPTRVLGLSKDEANARAEELLELVGLAGWAERYPSQLSGGQRQRMALARALAIEPEVLLLDEPFGALDAKVRADLREWLRRLHDEVHVTTVLVTHDQEEAMAIADGLVVLDHGRVQQTGAPRDVYERPANPFVMGFLGPVSRLGDRLLRPHDLSLSADPDDGAREAMVTRVVHLGFEVRVEVQLADDGLVPVQLTRAEAEQLELAPGDIVYLRATGAPALSG
jgi:sulfate transport system ATP-binding protein